MILVSQCIYTDNGINIHFYTVFSHIPKLPMIIERTPPILNDTLSLALPEPLCTDAYQLEIINAAL